MKNITSYLVVIIFITLFSSKASAEQISYEDRYAVYDLINSYSYGIDYYDTDMLLTIFASDGLFKVNANGELLNTREGAADLYTEFSERAARRIQNGAGDGHHFMTNIVIEMPSEGHITGKTMAIVSNRSPGEGVKVNTHGMYEWEFKKEGGEWKIARLELFYN
ncbi:MAG: nuclear transport factor 2 family protein [Gammaproteobacteria bacterium]|nr:nuclear transport factor 2 family protein [Gammaproteobacteria bacterium]